MKKFVLTAAVVMSFAASSAKASLIDFVGLGLNSAVQIQHNANTMNVNAGAMNIKIAGSPFVAFCVDLNHTIQSQWTATNIPVTSIIGGKAAAFLYDNYKNTLTTNTQAAALQVAIWEVVDDFGGSLDLNAGNFKLIGSSSVASQANAYLATLPANVASYVTTSYILHSGDNPQSQDLIVPEPGTLAALALALPLFVIRRRLA